jgi:hypothetical protein
MSQAARRSNEAHRSLRERPDWSRGRTILPSARGDTTEHHGPLQRLLGATLTRSLERPRHHARTTNSKPSAHALTVSGVRRAEARL